MPRFHGLDSHFLSSHGANEPMLARKREREGANPSRILVAQLLSLPHPHPTRGRWRPHPLEIGKWRPQMANGARNLLKMASTTPLIFCGAASASGARAARGNLQTLQCESTLRLVSPSLALWARCRGAAERAAEHGGDGARAIVHRRDLPFLRERRTRYAIFERRCGRHLPFMEVADAICLLWTPFAICGRHLPISRGC